MLREFVKYAAVATIGIRLGLSKVNPYSSDAVVMQTGLTLIRAGGELGPAMVAAIVGTAEMQALFDENIKRPLVAGIRYRGEALALCLAGYTAIGTLWGALLWLLPSFAIVFFVADWRLEELQIRNRSLLEEAETFDVIDVLARQVDN